MNEWKDDLWPDFSLLKCTDRILWRQILRQNNADHPEGPIQINNEIGFAKIMLLL